MKTYYLTTPAASVDLPAGLDPDRHRIILEHWFGRDPATLAAERAASPQFQHKVRKVVRLGERAVAELLAELAVRHDIGEELDGTLSRYAGLDPRLVAAVGGDRLPAPPVHEVQR